MERETKEFTTKGGHIVVYKTYLTGRESNEIQKTLLKDVNLEIGQSKLSPYGTTFKAENILELNNKTIELLIVSIDGEKEKVLDTILDLPNTEYAEITDQLNKISGDKKKD